MGSSRTAMECVINFLLPTWKKYKVVARRVYAVVTNVFPEGGAEGGIFLPRQTNEHDISADQIYLFLLYNGVLVIAERSRE